MQHYFFDIHFNIMSNLYLALQVKELLPVSGIMHFSSSAWSSRPPLFAVSKNLGEVGSGDVDWIGLAQDRNRWRAVVNSLLNLRVP
jgi:hypothetical protein